MIKRSLKNIFNSIAAKLGAHTKKTNEAKLWILMYHRVLPTEIAKELNEEPGMYVTPETFSNHLTWLKEIMEPIKLSDWVDHKNDNTLSPGNYFAITFDDGWQDNYQYAFPILKQHQLSATIFLVSSMMGTNKIFWPNRLASISTQLDDHNLKSEHLENLRKKLDINKNSDISEISDVIAKAKHYLDSELNDWLDNVETELNLDSRNRQLLNWQEIQDMLDSSLIDFGGHTKHHIRLQDNISKELIEDEVLGCQKEINSKASHTASLFCYPNGDYSDYSAELVQNNYSAAVTTQSGINDTNQVLHKLKRVGVHEDVSSTKLNFLARLSCWN